LLGISSGFSFFPDHISLLMVLVGLLLGFTGSGVSLLRFGRAKA